MPIAESTMEPISPLSFVPTTFVLIIAFFPGSFFSWILIQWILLLKMHSPTARERIFYFPKKKFEDEHGPRPSRPRTHDLAHSSEFRNIMSPKRLNENVELRPPKSIKLCRIFLPRNHPHLYFCPSKKRMPPSLFPLSDTRDKCRAIAFDIATPPLGRLV